MYIDKINNYNDFSDFYDEFRIHGEFFEDYELKYGSQLISSAIEELSSEINLLELGCGTGIWSKIIFDIAEKKNKKLKGYLIEPSYGMLIKAKSKLGKSNINFKNIDASKLLCDKINMEFDLIVSILSIDAIGLNTYKFILDSYLKKNGLSIFWIFNHERYNEINNGIMKEWTYKNKKIEIPSHRILKEDIVETFCNSKFDIVLHEVKLPEKKGISRGIYFGKIKFKKPFVNDIQNYICDIRDEKTTKA